MFNEIGDEGVEQLATALKTNRVRTDIPRVLSNNPITAILVDTYITGSFAQPG